MWDPSPFGNVRTSIPAPMAAPTSEPCDPPLVCVEINQDYIPFIAGAMSQLVQRTAWLATDEDDLQRILANMTWAIEIIGTAVQCNQPYLPPGQPTAVNACNIAGYLANYIIRNAIDKAIQSLQQDQQILGFLDILGPLFLPIFPITSAGIGAFIYLFNRIIPAEITAFQDAIDDPTLFGTIACAIYNAIATDGQVTAGNFPVIIDNITAISFASSYVKDTIIQMLNDLGASGLQSIQVPGVVASYDCSNCGTGPALGPVGPAPRLITGTDFLSIGIGFAAATLPILFPKEFSQPPLLTVGSDNQDVIASFTGTTATGTTLMITAAAPALATMAANVDWRAALQGVE